MPERTIEERLAIAEIAIDQLARDLAAQEEGGYDEEVKIRDAALLAAAEKFDRPNPL